MSNFKIKLKVPKNSIKSKEGGDDHEVAPMTPTPPPSPSPSSPPTTDESEDDVVKVKSHICPHCKKGFKCGKALGGHLRIHNNIEKSDVSNEDFEMIVDLTSDTSIYLNNIFECDFCDKVFPSERSLSGHMRSHPNRFHRRMAPPNNVPEGAAVERFLKLGSWKATKKRGIKKRKRLTSPPPEATSSSTTLPDSLDASFKLIDGSVNLFILAGGDEDDEKAKRAKKSKGLMRSLYDNNSNKDEYYYLKKAGYLLDSESDDDEVNVNVDSQTGLDHTRSDRMKKVIEKIEKLYQKAISINEWKCNSCGKIFTTHEALGGHKASHKREKLTDNNGGGSSGGGGQDDVAVSEPSHKCNVCNKTFSSGQALGGHKRIHSVQYYTG